MAETEQQVVAEEWPQIGASPLSELLQKEFRARTPEHKGAVEQAVRTLAAQALEHTKLISDNVVQSIEGLIAEIDRKLSEQINLVIHHPDFLKLEGAWRGLYFLVNNTETDEMLKIRVMNISKSDLYATLRKFKGVAWDQSPLFKQIYEEEYGMFGGQPFGVMIGDYYFDNSEPDVDMLREVCKISAAAHVPFIAGASPTVMRMDSWQELSNPRDLTKIFQILAEELTGINRKQGSINESPFL
jgi:type VI secretion system protein ImpC